MKKASFLEALIVLMFLATLSISSVMASTPVEETKRDPTEGFSSPPGQSYSWAYQYGLYHPETKTYSGITQYHDYNWSDTGTYDPNTPESKDAYHPWVQTYVRYWYQGAWMLDTFVEIKW